MDEAINALHRLVFANSHLFDRYSDFDSWNESETEGDEVYTNWIIRCGSQKPECVWGPL